MWYICAQAGEPEGGPGVPFTSLLSGQEEAASDGSDPVLISFLGELSMIARVARVWLILVVLAGVTAAQGGEGAAGKKGWTKASALGVTVMVPSSWKKTDDSDEDDDVEVVGWSLGEKEENPVAAFGVVLLKQEALDEGLKELGDSKPSKTTIASQPATVHVGSPKEEAATLVHIAVMDQATTKPGKRLVFFYGGHKKAWPTHKPTFDQILKSIVIGKAK